jgi:hypothetical protein
MYMNIKNILISIAYITCKFVWSSTIYYLYIKIEGWHSRWQITCHTS